MESLFCISTTWSSKTLLHYFQNKHNISFITCALACPPVSCTVNVARLLLYYSAHSLNSVESGGRSVWASMSFSCPWADPELEPTSPNGWEPAWKGCKIGLGQARPGPSHGLQGMLILFWNGQTKSGSPEELRTTILVEEIMESYGIIGSQTNNQTKLGLNVSFYSLNRSGKHASQAKPSRWKPRRKHRLALSRWVKPRRRLLFRLCSTCNKTANSVLSDSSTCSTRQKQRAAYEVPQALFSHMHLP